MTLIEKYRKTSLPGILNNAAASIISFNETTLTSNCKNASCFGCGLMHEWERDGMYSRVCIAVETQRITKIGTDEL